MTFRRSAPSRSRHARCSSGWRPARRSRSSSRTCTGAPASAGTGSAASSGRSTATRCRSYGRCRCWPRRSRGRSSTSSRGCAGRSRRCSRGCRASACDPRRHRGRAAPAPFAPGSSGPRVPLRELGSASLAETAAAATSVIAARSATTVLRLPMPFPPVMNNRPLVAAMRGSDDLTVDLPPRAKKQRRS